MRVIVGEGSCGLAAGAGKVYEALQTKLEGIESASLGITGCVGMCWLEPIVDLYNGKMLAKRLVHVAPEDADDIAAAVQSGDLSLVDRITIRKEDEDFLRKQTRIALRHCGVIDPADINDYMADDGYQALEKVLGTMTPEEVIEEIKVSGLAGRGGA